DLGGQKAAIFHTVNVGANATFRAKAWFKITNGNCPGYIAWNPGATCDGTGTATDSCNPELANTNHRIRRADSGINSSGFTLAASGAWHSATIYGQADATGN